MKSILSSCNFATTNLFIVTSKSHPKLFNQFQANFVKFFPKSTHSHDLQTKSFEDIPSFPFEFFKAYAFRFFKPRSPIERQKERDRERCSKCLTRNEVQIHKKRSIHKRHQKLKKFASRQSIK